MATLKLTGRFLLDYAKPCVYLWKRGEACLYIGASKQALGRVGYHNVIGKRKPLQPRYNVASMPLEIFRQRRRQIHTGPHARKLRKIKTTWRKHND